MKNSVTKLAFFSATLGSLTSVNAATILANGSFENYGGTGFNSNIGAGLTGWTIGPSGGIDLIIYGAYPGHWIAEDGNISLSLNWYGSGRISQSVSTTTGQLYSISFYMGAELNGGPPVRTMDVLWNGTVVGSPSFNYTAQPITNMGWQQYSFVAQGTGSDTLTFASTTGANYGPALDNVTLSPIPEPTSIVSSVFGLLGINFCRRRPGQTNKEFKQRVVVPS